MFSCFELSVNLRQEKQNQIQRLEIEFVVKISQNRRKQDAGKKLVLWQPDNKKFVGDAPGVVVVVFAAVCVLQNTCFMHAKKPRKQKVTLYLCILAVHFFHKTFYPTTFLEHHEQFFFLFGFHICSLNPTTTERRKERTKKEATANKKKQILYQKPRPSGGSFSLFNSS